MVDRTVCVSKDATPDLALRQVLGRHKTPQELCLLFANSSLLSIEMVAVLGENHESVKRNFLQLIGGAAVLGADDRIRALRYIQVITVWTTCQALNTCNAQRRAKMEEDPHKIPEIPQEDHGDFRSRFVLAHPDVVVNIWNEPHRKFVERINRDFTVNGSIPFYEVGEMRTRSEVIAQKSGLAPSADQLVKLCRTDELSSSFATEEEVFQRLHAFFMTLEMLNICSFTTLDGPVLYISKIHKCRKDCAGLQALVKADKIIRMKVAECNTDQRDDFPTYSSALKHVLDNHKHLWIEARSHGRSVPAPTTPTNKRSFATMEADHGSPKITKSAKKRQAQQAKLQGLKAHVVDPAPQFKEKGKGKGKGPQKGKGGAVSSASRISPVEWEKLCSFSYSGARRCRFFNSSKGCSSGNQCKQEHLCVQCGADHCWFSAHGGL